MSYKGVTVELPLPPPDQQTSNGIWQTIAGGAIALAGVALGAWVLKEKD
jgi:hypothetical protein